jgi:hypothetical protein
MTDFGRDVLCLDSLLSGRYASGLRLLGQRCYHRLITPRGTLRGGPDEGNFGLDLASMVGGASTAAQRAALPSQIENELRKDPEVEACSVTIEWFEASDHTVTAEVTASVTAAAGPFELVMAVSAVSARVLRLVV